MVINALKGMVVSLATIKTVMTEVEISTHLTVEPRAFNRSHVAAVASGGGHGERRRDGKGREEGSLFQLVLSISPEAVCALLS